MPNAALIASGSIEGWAEISSSATPQESTRVRAAGTA